MDPPAGAGVREHVHDLVRVEDLELPAVMLPADVDACGGIVAHAPEPLTTRRVGRRPLAQIEDAAQSHEDLDHAAVVPGLPTRGRDALREVDAVAEDARLSAAKSVLQDGAASLRRSLVVQVLQAAAAQSLSTRQDRLRAHDFQDVIFGGHGRSVVSFCGHLQHVLGGSPSWGGPVVRGRGRRPEACGDEDRSCGERRKGK
mmetsp:Transcript_49349/g.138207  ORF Transcript_49349/g.138207 Transcript_49349/m.138207 type:complete len:201 (+) Transcript_49349:243-845(+)